MANESDADGADRVSEEAPTYGARNRVVTYEFPPRTALAPDGLPWPEGYFDSKLRVTLDDAIARSGVRPSKYMFGRPLYTQEDRDNPNYIDRYKPDPEWIAEILAEADRREKAREQ
ncbi:MAG: hypothetical protein WCT04_08540 [Planctomycetota bacterium]